MQMMADKLKCVKKFFSDMASYSLGKDYELSVALYPDAQTDEAICSHSIGGSSRHGLLKLAFLFLGAVLGIALIAMILRAINSCFRD